MTWHLYLTCPLYFIISYDKARMTRVYIFICRCFIRIIAIDIIRSLTKLSQMTDTVCIIVAFSSMFFLENVIN